MRACQLRLSFLRRLHDTTLERNDSRDDWLLYSNVCRGVAPCKPRVNLFMQVLTVGGADLQLASGSEPIIYNCHDVFYPGSAHTYVFLTNEILHHEVIYVKLPAGYHRFIAFMQAINAFMQDCQCVHAGCQCVHAGYQFSPTSSHCTDAKTALHMPCTMCSFTVS